MYDQVPSLLLVTSYSLGEKIKLRRLITLRSVSVGVDLDSVSRLMESRYEADMAVVRVDRVTGDKGEI